MRLSNYFTLPEMCKTSTGLPNNPSDHQLLHLQRLCKELDELREFVGPIRVTSGFRSAAVNAQVGGSRTSAHMDGLAADIVAVNTPRDRVWSRVILMMRSGWGVDQAIIYESAPHIHIGFTCGPARGQILVATSSGAYVPWHGYRGSLS